MRGDLLFIPPSSVQFLYQVAAVADQRGAIPSAGEALSDSYLFEPAMRDTLREISEAFNLRYHGNLTPTGFQGIQAGGRKQRILRLLGKRPKRFSTLLREHGMPNDLHCETLVCCVRPVCYDEMLLWEALKPSSTVWVIDGVNPRPPSRSLVGPKWKGINFPFRDIPSNLFVNCPTYLESDAKQLGLPRVFSDEILYNVFLTYTRTPVASRFREFWGNTTIGQRVAVVFSQHLSVSGYCSAQAEIAYYVKVASWLIKHGWTRVLVKAHPRDPIAKMQALTDIFDKAFGQVCCVVPDEFRAVAMEPFLLDSLWIDAIGVSVNSSVLLSFRQLTGCSAISFTSDQMDHMFLSEVTGFCRDHKIEQECL